MKEQGETDKEKKKQKAKGKQTDMKCLVYNKRNCLLLKTLLKTKQKQMENYNNKKRERKQKDMLLNFAAKQKTKQNTILSQCYRCYR